MPDTDDELLNSSDDNDDLHETYCLGQSMPTQSQTQGSHLSQDVPSEAHRSLRYQFFSSRCASSLVTGLLRMPHMAWNQTWLSVVVLTLWA